MPGPVPKRSSQRRRRNKPEGGLTVVEMPLVPPVEAPEPSGEWHQLARDWFVSLGESGQSQFFEPSDWAVAKFCAHLMSEELESGKASRSMMVAEITKLMGSLLSTEGDRRRVRLELQRGGEDKADSSTSSILAAYRDEFGA